MCVILCSYPRADGSGGPGGGAEGWGVGGERGGVLGQEVVSRGDGHVIDMLEACRSGDEVEARRGERRTRLRQCGEMEKNRIEMHAKPNCSITA